MKRLTLYILLFCLALCLPLSYVIWRTYTGVTQEEQAQLRFFAETLFDDMERELADLVRREENRAVDQYHHPISDGGPSGAPSPLSAPPEENYILGYLQNNPDGSLQLPLVPESGQLPETYRARIDQLNEANRLFNQKRFALKTEGGAAPPQPVGIEPPPTARSDFAERYRAPSERPAPKAALGQKSVRMEEITARQAAKLTQAEIQEAEDTMEPAALSDSEMANGRSTRQRSAMGATPDGPSARSADSTPPTTTRPPGRFQVEVAPMQTVFLDEHRLFIFRRVMIDDQIFRQGFVLDMDAFLSHLARTHFAPHPMADFTRLHLMAMRSNRIEPIVDTGAGDPNAALVAARTFPAPFQLFSAAVRSDGVPASTTRRHLNTALAGLAVVMLLGLIAIYHNVRTVVALSERRAQFASSVTHELKTPLTNIRLYADLLSQGVATTPQRQDVYLGVIGSESARLSRLIDNVLELSRLEKRQRRLRLKPGRLEEALSEVQSMMAPKLEQEGFEMTVKAETLPELAYDREAMIQVLINLMENSIKFGRNSQHRQITIRVRHDGQSVYIAVSDMGPGIPRKALKRIFDDYYRADNALTCAAGGTGIGLALVRKLVHAMGGRVSAANNSGPGCTITVTLPMGVQGA